MLSCVLTTLTAPCWMSSMDPCHHCHLQAALLLMRLCHGIGIGMVSGHCSVSDGTGPADLGLEDSPPLGLFWWIRTFHAFGILFFCMFPYQKPLRVSCAVLGIRGAVRVEVVEGQHVSVPQLVLQTSRGTQLSAQQCAVFV